MLPKNTKICHFYVVPKHQKGFIYINYSCTADKLWISHHYLFRPSTEIVADINFLKVLFQEMMIAVTEEVFRDIERTLSVSGCPESSS